MYTILYFSATGNTKYLVNRLDSNLSQENQVMSIEDVNESTIYNGEHLVFMYPIHGFNPPRTVKRFISNLPVNIFKTVSLVAVGCNEMWFNDAVSLGIRRKLVKKGISIKLDEVIAMPLTLVMDFPDEVKKETIEKANSKIDDISRKILANEISTKKVKFKSKVVSTIGKIEDPAARLFGLELHANKKCISCKLCWESCPEENIKQSKKNKPKFGLSCSMCMRCIYSCPEQAISPYISKFLTIKGGYSLEKKQEI